MAAYDFTGNLYKEPITPPVPNVFDYDLEVTVTVPAGLTLSKDWNPAPILENIAKATAVPSSDPGHQQEHDEQLNYFLPHTDAVDEPEAAIEFILIDDTGSEKHKKKYKLRDAGSR